MHPLCPLLGVLILSAVLSANYFRTAWRLGILRAFGRRADLSWRVVTAGSVAACLPFAGALLALYLMPTSPAGDLEISSLGLALEMSMCGLFMHMVNDWIIVWGSPQTA